MSGQDISTRLDALGILAPAAADVYERSKNDREIIVGSEIRQALGQLLSIIEADRIDMTAWKQDRDYIRELRQVNQATYAQLVYWRNAYLKAHRNEVVTNMLFGAQAQKIAELKENVAFWIEKYNDIVYDEETSQLAYWRNEALKAKAREATYFQTAKFEYKRAEKAEAALAAERAKRCETCSKRDDETRCPFLPKGWRETALGLLIHGTGDAFSCSQWETQP